MHIPHNNIHVLPIAYRKLWGMKAIGLSQPKDQMEPLVFGPFPTHFIYISFWM